MMSLQSHLPIVYKMTKERYSGNSLNKNLHFIQMAAEQHKSAITDHVADTNHKISWDNAKIRQRRTEPPNG